MRLFLVLMLVASPTRAQESDGLAFSVEAVGHVPGDLPVLDNDTADIDLAQLSPPVHEASFAFGVRVTALSSDLSLRLGYRFGGADLPERSEVGNQSAARVDLTAVPITVAWRMTLLGTRVRPLLGVDLGGAAAELRYTTTGDPIESGWSWRWEARARIGVHADTWEWLGVRAFVEGRWAQRLWIDPGPDLDTTGVGFGLSVVAHLDRPEPGFFGGNHEDDRELLRSYKPLDGSRLDRAFEDIRAADDAVKRRDFLAAAELYERALARLPRDPETQRNVAAPVHVDRARVLIEIGRTEDARAELEAALAIAPTYPVARQLLESLE